jgi:hypothetical protein
MVANNVILGNIVNGTITYLHEHHNALRSYRHQPKEHGKPHRSSSLQSRSMQPNSSMRTRRQSR